MTLTDEIIKADCLTLQSSASAWWMATAQKTIVDGATVTRAARTSDHNASPYIVRSRAAFDSCGGARALPRLACSLALMCHLCRALAAVLLELPVAVVEWAHLPRLQPAADAVEMERVVATPHATVHSSEVADAWLAWHSMHRSMMWLRQIAQLSTTISHAHSETADHFFTTKRFSAAEPPAFAGGSTSMASSPLITQVRGAAAVDATALCMRARRAARECVARVAAASRAQGKARTSCQRSAPCEAVTLPPSVALDAQVHDVVAADRAVVHDDICARRRMRIGRIQSSAAAASRVRCSRPARSARCTQAPPRHATPPPVPGALRQARVRTAAQRAASSTQPSIFHTTRPRAVSAHPMPTARRPTTSSRQSA
eukprot:CAMPEP_0119434086 /NCGR_PEP_ID=MMETSP1335-20130426/50488_1 /TAXON_ID=259385 /ORGANISM="Chrysoculter rhomboideus, Strain RCC1486" /LENGTH=371 /DNA_ID=CAMNT_0007459937 /DNA_START=234 /DNA_END=1349 /DNA_ORIENTATION=+